MSPPHSSNETHHPIPVADLYRQVAERLRLSWVAGRQGGQRLLTSDTIQRPSLAPVDPRHTVQPNRIQVLTGSEMAHLRQLSGMALEAALSGLFGADTAAVVVADGELPGAALTAAAERSTIPLFCSPEPGPALLRILSHLTTQALAPSTVIHGVFLEVLGLGVLLTGDPAIGKSELALALINRGHRLVADDVLEVFVVAPDTLEGRCPVLLRDYMEVRGLGMLNIRSLFGETAVKYQKNIKLIIHLTMADQCQEMDRLDMQASERVILGVSVPEVQIPVAAGRNLAVLVEVAVRNHLLKLRGNDPTADFIERQRQAIEAAGSQGEAP